MKALYTPFSKFKPRSDTAMNDLCFNAVDLYAAASPFESNRHLQPSDEIEGDTWFLRAGRAKTKLLVQRIFCTGLPNRLIKGMCDGR